MRHYPSTRMRRMRHDDFSRRLMRETRLHCDDLIYPLFVIEGHNKNEPIASLPGSQRLSCDLLVKEAERAYLLGIPAVALFPVIAPDKKDAQASGAYDEQGLIPTAIRTLKQALPELGVISDIALDPYTLDAQDGLTDSSGYVMNDETVAVLCRQALCHAAAGADMVAPSDMMDGRIQAIREVLEMQRFFNTRILAYTAKYASNFYAPFRDAIQSKDLLGNADKNTYQIDPSNAEEALTEVELDLSEGADIIMVKPALPYLDLIRRIKEKFTTPLFAYQVSGEYAMLKAAAHAGWIEEQPCVLETLTSIKRAGANAILTYYALTVAQWLRNPE